MRFPIQLPITVRGSLLSEEYHGVTRDMSLRGVFFYVDNWPLKESAIEFEISLPADIMLAKRIRASGTVVRVESDPKSGRTGIAATLHRNLRFTDIS